VTAGSFAPLDPVSYLSGGVTLERIPELAATGADFVSSGALTHSAPAADISFEIEPA
jgi:nicotinate-nucleotide pyrophosphorylase (carboxylating)